METYQKPTLYKKIAYWLDSHITPLYLRPLFTKPIFREGELETILKTIREDKEKYEKETGKPYKLPIA